MAWNEPGGSGKKDPWGGGNGDQGPPDLDEVVKKMQDKFGSIFGGGKGGSSGGGGAGKAGSIGIGLILVVAAIVYGVSGLYIIEEGTRGVVLQFGKYNKTSLPGLHWYPRFIQSVETVDIEQIRDAAIGYRTSGGTRTATTRVDRESLMLTQDENIVDVQLAVQYKVKSASDYLFNVVDPDITLRQATESAIREIIGKNKMDFVITEGRGAIASRVQILTQEILDRYETGLELTSVNMQDAQPPEQVQAAYANDIIPRAQGQAAREIEEANAYKDQVIAEATGEASRFNQVLAEYKKAPEVTRKRLYIESIESVMANTSKVMVDTKGSSNLLYLPLDKLMEQQRSLGSINLTRGQESQPTSRTSADQRTRDLRENVRSRERR